MEWGETNNEFFLFWSQKIFFFLSAIGVINKGKVGECKKESKEWRGVSVFWSTIGPNCAGLTTATTTTAGRQQKFKRRVRQQYKQTCRCRDVKASSTIYHHHHHHQQQKAPKFDIRLLASNPLPPSRLQPLFPVGPFGFDLIITPLFSRTFAHIHTRNTSTPSGDPFFYCQLQPTQELDYDTFPNLQEMI